MEKNELARRIYDGKQIDRVEKKIDLLGRNKKINVLKFLNIRIIGTLLIFLVCLYVFSFGYILAPLVSALFFIFYERFILDDKIKRRRVILENEAIQFFEILTLSLETGRNLEEAILVASSNENFLLSCEFNAALRETKFGKSLQESLIDMQKYIPSSSINNIILALSQSNIYGNSIIETMYNQIDYLRNRKTMEVKAEISKVPVKISIISVLFFVPLILLIILGPVIIKFIGI